jgi:hypothetical protein
MPHAQMRRKRPEKRSQRPQTRLDWFRRFRDDPQDVGVGIPTGQTGGSCRAGEESTCGLFASVQDVWSPRSPTASSVYSPGTARPGRRSRRGAGVNDRQNDRARRAAPIIPGLCLHCSPVEALVALERSDCSVDKIRHVQQHGWLLMITSSAEVDAGSGRGARKLGNFKFCSHQSGPL